MDSSTLLNHPKVDYLSVTHAAKNAIKQCLNDKDNYVDNVRPHGLKVIVPERGCGGLSYEIELAYYGQNITPQDELLKIDDDAFLFIDPSAVLTVFGSVVDFQESGVEYGFKFTNPNEAGTCGCGSSFFIEQKIEE